VQAWSKSPFLLPGKTHEFLYCSITGLESRSSGWFSTAECLVVALSPAKPLPREELAGLLAFWEVNSREFFNWMLERSSLVCSWMLRIWFNSTFALLCLTLKFYSPWVLEPIRHHFKYCCSSFSAASCSFCICLDENWDFRMKTCY